MPAVPIASRTAYHARCAFKAVSLITVPVTVAVTLDFQYCASVCDLPYCKYCTLVCRYLQSGSSHTVRHMYTLYPVLFSLAFLDAITSASSAAESQSLQRAPLTRPGTGSTAHSHTHTHTQAHTHTQPIACMASMACNAPTAMHKGKYC
eukprot:363236-Chlamydomonas_euryale.AAC.3